MLAANFVYCFWGVFLVMIVTALDITLGLNTHYALGPAGQPMALGSHLLGHVIEIVVMTLLTSTVSLITANMNAKAVVSEPAASLT